MDEWVGQNGDDIATMFGFAVDKLMFEASFMKTFFKTLTLHCACFRWAAWFQLCRFKNDIKGCMFRSSGNMKSLMLCPTLRPC